MPTGWVACCVLCVCVCLSRVCGASGVVVRVSRRVVVGAATQMHSKRTHERKCSPNTQSTQSTHTVRHLWRLPERVLDLEAHDRAVVGKEDRPERVEDAKGLVINRYVLMRCGLFYVCECVCLCVCFIGCIACWPRAVCEGAFCAGGSKDWRRQLPRRRRWRARHAPSAAAAPRGRSACRGGCRPATRRAPSPTSRSRRT